MKRSRRTLKEVRAVRKRLLEVLAKHTQLSLSQIMEFGDEIGVRDTPSDRSLVKKQLDYLEELGSIELSKVGRNWIARLVTPARNTPAVAVSGPELEAIKAYALQLEQFAKALQEQIQIMVRMVEKACHGSSIGSTDEAAERK